MKRCEDKKLPEIENYNLKTFEEEHQDENEHACAGSDYSHQKQMFIHRQKMKHLERRRK